MEEEKIEGEKFEDFEAFEHKKICIVEDDDDIREIYSTKLKIGGYEVLEAINGEDGLNVIREKKPDLILLDLMMPVLDGYGVLKELAKDKELSEIPVIVLTNLDFENAEDKVGKYETRFYVVKSMTTPEKLYRMVREVVH